MAGGRQVWVVGRIHPEEHQFSWEIVGVFSDRERARGACANRNDFVAPILLNVRLPEERVEWPEAVFPLA